MLEGLFGILAFFATLLALVSGVVVIVAALVTRRPRRAGKVGLVLLVWLGVYLLLLLGASFTSRPRTLGLNQERCFDEMCYSVTAVKIAPTLTDVWSVTFRAQGNYYILTIQLRNAGRGTAQKPSNPAVFVIDAQGKSYTHYFDFTSRSFHVPTSMPGGVYPLWSEKIQAGAVAVRTVVFDLPADIQQPGLVVSEGIGPLSVILIGDEGSLFHAKTEFLLNPPVK